VTSCADETVEKDV